MVMMVTMAVTSRTTSRTTSIATTATSLMLERIDDILHEDERAPH